MRLFLALEVRPVVTGSRPEDPLEAPEHLTLRFLGEVPPEQVRGIEAAMERVARTFAPFDLVLEGVGAFPSRSNPRVVWVGATQGRREVTELAARLAAELKPGGAASSREEFVPHLTLFRVRSPQLRRRAADLLSGTEPPPPPRTVPVREIYLKESTLTSEGAQHRTLAVSPLTGRSAPSA